MTEKIFGSRSEFGIRYISGWKTQDGDHCFAKLHLFLKGELIGDQDETCLVNSWISSMEEMLKLIRDYSTKLYHPEFCSRTDDEIFELIYKSNQLPDEFNEKYLYLPVLSNEVWQYCNVEIDETIDNYLLTMNCHKNVLKFIWKGWRSPCPKERINELLSISLDKDEVCQIIKECLDYVRRETSNYRLKKHTSVS